MTSVPQTRYAKAAEGGHIAYQVVGDGPIDLIFVPDWWNHIEAQWEEPALERFLHRLASFSRLILFDKRGMGASDPVSQNALPTLEDWIEDVHVVMEATDCQQAAVFASSGGGPMGLLFAATYPQRTSALILVNTAARIAAANDYPIGVPARVIDNYLNWLGENWGTPAILDLYGPSVSADARFRQWFARYLRLSQSPGIAVAVQRMLCELDLRQVLPTLSCPALVMHRTDDRAVSVALGRYLATHIEGSKYVELAGEDHLLYTGDADALLDEVEEFLTGAHRAPKPDRVLATVLFTDIVGSTERAGALGDRGWRDLLDAHDRYVRRAIEQFRGHEENTTGDGFFVTFDGPGRAIHCACAIRDAMRDLGIEVRAGLHTGEVELRDDHVSGIAIHIGARVCAFAGPGEVLASGAIPPLVAGSGIAFEDRGEHQLKGIPDTWHLFAVDG